MELQMEHRNSYSADEEDAECVGEELEIYSKVGKGNTEKDHAVSIRSHDSGVRLFDNACVNESVEFSVTNLANKMIDYYHDIYEKGKNRDK